MNSKVNYINKISKKLLSLGLKPTDTIEVDFENGNKGIPVSTFLEYMTTWDEYTQRITLKDLSNIHQQRGNVMNYLTWIGIGMEPTL